MPDSGAGLMLGCLLSLYAPNDVPASPSHGARNEPTAESIADEFKFPGKVIKMRQQQQDLLALQQEGLEQRARLDEEEKAWSRKKRDEEQALGEERRKVSEEQKVRPSNLRTRTTQCILVVDVSTSPTSTDTVHTC